MSSQERITHYVEKMKAGERGNHPFDSRFPNSNQTRNCWQNYVDFHRCLKVKGDDYTPCSYFKRVYKALCPTEWTEKWDDQREQGTFAAKY